MKLEFTKMQGCGNDYIYVSCFDREIDDPSGLAIKLSDRHFGIGGDGLILICPSGVADARMRMFNADGSEGKMCGNGVRCVGKYIYDKGIARKNKVKIETLSGIKTLSLDICDGVAVGAVVDMGKPELSPERIPVLLDGSKVIDRPISIGGSEYRVSCVSMGNPHCVVFLPEVKTLDLPEIGRKFESSPLFPESVNTEFVRVIDPRTLEMRVWERGSGETLACGTGACASVAAAVENGFCRLNEEVTVRLLGGELYITCTGETVLMRGSAETVFEGTTEIADNKSENI